MSVLRNSRPTLLGAVRPIQLFCALVAVVVIVAACAESIEPRVPTTLVLDPSPVQMEWGLGTARITPEILDQHGVPFSIWPQGHLLTWFVDDPEVVMVMGRNDPFGNLRPAWGGQTILTATAGELPPIDVYVTVLPPPDTIAGEVRFQYAGDTSGSFVVSDTWPFDHRNPAFFSRPAYLEMWGERAASWYAADWGGQIIQADRRTTAGIEDRLYMYVEGRLAESGTHEVSVTLQLNYNTKGIQTASPYTGRGHMTVTSISDSRLSGRFSVGLSQLLNEEGDRNVIEIVDGRIDVPLLMDAPWP